MARIKDLGIATAYGYAVSKGYAGTEEEFAELMASYAEVAERADQSAEDSEAWAVGTRNGSAVLPEDETYDNNSKYWASKAHEDSENIDYLIGRSGYLQIGIDGNGHLQVIKNNAVDVTFNISDDGHLVIGGLN